jgi:tryptophan halogenase
VIAGGGTAGWIAAAALSRQLGPLLEITLVESEALGTIGVGEATIPTARSFHDYLRIDEQAFCRATQATFKLGIAFENWGAIGERYIHSFGTVPLGSWMADFPHFWLEARKQGFAGDLAGYYPEALACEAGVFAKGGERPLNYAYHLDATRYAKFLRQISENEGVKRIEGQFASVEMQGESGDIAALVLEDGRRIEGDLFIDCTGFRAKLIGEAMGVGYVDWSHWLPTNSAIAVQTLNPAEPVPYTRAIAHDAGWQWRIPLQKRMGNGIVFAREFLDMDAARERLLASVEGKVLTEPRVIQYQTGRREQVWAGNCVALGLSSGFIEPLESTSIHLFMIGVTRLIQQFPFGAITPAVRARYNEIAIGELECVRDFVVAHYKLTRRDDSPFWRMQRDMAVPDSLAARLDLFAQSGQTWQAPGDLFRMDSWMQVLMGQGANPASWHQAASLVPAQHLRGQMAAWRADAAKSIVGLPQHKRFVEQWCPALD